MSDIYPVNFSISRDITQEEKDKVEKAFKHKNNKNLILALLDLERFPIDDPHIGFLRKHREAFDKNPKTIKRIGGVLFGMGLSGIFTGVSQPKSPSRQFGPMFKKWLSGLNYPLISSEEEFLDAKGISILDGGDAKLEQFAQKHLGYKRNKGLDIILKANNKFIIGEAKFISTSGGTQDKSFREIINFIKKENKRFISIGILDGVVWLSPLKEAKKKTNLYESIIKLNKNQVVLSALLLKEFIESQK